MTSSSLWKKNPNFINQMTNSDDRGMIKVRGRIQKGELSVAVYHSQYSMTA